MALSGRGGWTIGENTATCRGQGTHPGIAAPVHDCECGLYAVNAVEHIPSMRSLPAVGPARIYGTVLAWGRIEVHRTGFRAQYAEPVVLAYNPEDSYRHVSNLKAIMGEMDLPLVELGDLERASEGYGEPVPMELRPAPSSNYEGCPRCSLNGRVTRLHLDVKRQMWECDECHMYFTDEFLRQTVRKVPQSFPHWSMSATFPPLVPHPDPLYTVRVVDSAGRESASTPLDGPAGRTGIVPRPPNLP